jgi:HSP20 family protein
MPEPTRLPVKADKSSLPQTWQPFESLRRDIDRLFDDFGVGFWRTPSAGLPPISCLPGAGK